MLRLPLWRVIFPLIFLGLYTWLCAKGLPAFDRADRPTPDTERRFLLLLSLAAPLVQLALAAGVYRYPLFQFFAATVSPSISGYYSVAVTTIDLPDLLARYVEWMPLLPTHPQSHPPGPVLIHWWGWQFFAALPALASAVAMPLRALQCHNAALMTLDNGQIASATIGLLLPLLGGLAVWPMYAFGKRVAGARAAALVAGLFPILPLFAMWPAEWDQVYPLLLFTGLYLAQAGLESRSTGRLFAAGVPLSIATFFSVGNVVLVAIVGLYSLVWIIAHHEDATKQGSVRVCVAAWIRPAIALALGCASIWLIYAAVYRVNPLDVIATGSRLAFESTTGHRSYSLWLIWNPIDFATFFSLPLTLLLLTRLPAVITAVRDLLRGRAPGRSNWALIAAVALASFVALNVSGTVRGEVGRLWMYFGPLLALTALAPSPPDAQTTADARAPHEGGRSISPALLIGLVGLQLIAMNMRWLVNDSFLDEPPERQANFAAPDPQVDLQVSFDRQIALLGYDAGVANAALDLVLHWQALAQPPHAYTVFVHVLDADGQPIGQRDNMPMRDQLPTSCWQPGEVVADPYTVTLPAGARGPFSIQVGLYRLDTGQRLHLDNRSGMSVTLTVPEGQ